MEDYKLLLDNLRTLIRSPKSFETAIEKTLELHAITHTKEVSSSTIPTFCDTILDSLQDSDYSILSEKNETIAWTLWHLARIEDMVGNLLIARQNQIFNDNWMKTLNVKIKDTGNAMTNEQIIDFSAQVNKKELLRYRNAVGCGTRNIIKSLHVNDLKRKPEPEYLERLLSESCLLTHKSSLWLKDFWGRYTVSGLMLLPLTYHHMLHLPNCVTIKQNRNEPPN